MKKRTLLSQLGRHSYEQQGSVNPPLVQTSTILFETLEAYEAAERGKTSYPAAAKSSTNDKSYGIGGTETSFALQEALQTLESADCCVLTPSGLSAITFALLSTLQTGDHILVADSVYGPNRRFCMKELPRMGIQANFFDPKIGEEIELLFTPATRAIFLESPGSLTFEMQDLQILTNIAKKHGLITLFDNSWASSLHFQPLNHGIDISIQAVTKYVGGHSDIIMGAVLANGEMAQTLLKRQRHFGITTSPHDCWLALRGLRTMAVRMETQQETALQIADWLLGREEVAEIRYPASPKSSGHSLWKRDYTGGATLITVLLKKYYEKDQIAAMLNGMAYFGIGASWGGYESLITSFDPTSIRTATKWQHQGSAIRLYIGLEAAEDLISDLESGLERLK